MVSVLNPFYSSVGGVLFDKSQTTLLKCPPGKAGSYAIPGTVMSIGDGAFSGCISLTNVTLGSNVTSLSVGNLVCSECPNLTSITVSALNPFYSSVGGVLFDKSQTTLLNCPPGKTGSYVIPSTVTNIGDGAFSGCINLTGVTIPDSVTSIGDDAFYGCSSLAGVNFRGNAPAVGSSVFSGDTQATANYLTGATGWSSTLGGIPAVLWNPPVPYTYTTNNGTITITGYTGSGGPVDIPNAINFLPVTSIKTGAFYGNAAITSATIPGSVSTIGASAFSTCTNLACVILGEGVTGIEQSAFQHSTGLASITVPDTVTNIADIAFWYTGLTNFTIPSRVTRIGAYCFGYCPLSSISIPDSVTDIGYEAFWFFREVLV